MLPFFTFLFLFQLACTQLAGSGYRFASFNQFPYIVSVRLVKGNFHICVGSIIHPKWVLTCANCYLSEKKGQPNLQGRDLVIYTRTLDSNGTLGDAILGKNLIVNSGFNWKSAINNIALIELTIPLRTIKPISIGYPEGKSTVLSASWTTVTKNWTMETFKKLRFYYLTTVVSSPDGCTSNSEFICTLNKPNDKVCHFDAGAPLIEKSHSGDKLVGVGSHLLTECHGQSGGVFTRVANFIPWIKSVTRVYFRA